MSSTLFTVVMMTFLTFGKVPSQELGWNKPGVSEADFRQDLNECSSVFDEVWTNSITRRGIRQNILESVETFTTEYKDETASYEAYAVCFLSRGYQYTALTYSEARRLNDRSLSENRRARYLYQIAIDNRSDTRDFPEAE